MAGDGAPTAWPPALAAASLPVAFRFGAAGAGLFAGCGAGVGFWRPVDLAGVPGLASVAGGVAAGLSAAGAPLGGAGAALRRAIGGLGVRGLDAGMGCGVGLGYGVGAGLFLKPNAVESLAAGAASCAHWARERLAAAGLHLPSAAAPEPSSPAGAAGWEAAAAAARPPPGPAAAAGPSGRPPPPPPAAALDRGVSDDLRIISSTLLRQEAELAALRAEGRELRRALCRLDGSAPFCGLDEPG